LTLTVLTGRVIAIRCVVTAEGLSVRNLFSSFDLQWEEVTSLTFGRLCGLSAAPLSFSIRPVRRIYRFWPLRPTLHATARFRRKSMHDEYVRIRRIHKAYFETVPLARWNPDS
jgi:hypothetical protein